MARTAVKPIADVQENDPGMKLIETTYPDLPGTDYTGDITVGLNGVMYKIQRGVKVKVPVAVDEIIQRSMAEDTKVERKIRQLQEEGKRASATL